MLRSGLLLAGVALTFPSIVRAECKCPEMPDLNSAFKRANTVFIGTVLKVTKSPVKVGYHEVKLSLMKRLKGFDEILGENVYIFTPLKPDDCGYPFSEGQDYVVFAQGNPAGLRTTACHGTNYLDNMTSQIDAILKLAESAK